MLRVLHFANGAPAAYQEDGSALHFMLDHDNDPQPLSLLRLAQYKCDNERYDYVSI